MIFKLSNGEEVNLVNNRETAKFLTFVYPRLGTVFVGEIPRLVYSEEVKKFQAINRQIQHNRHLKAARDAARQQLIEEYTFDEFDDDIPF